MRIYLAIKFHADNKNRSLIEEIVSNLETQGHSVICAVKDFESWGSQIIDPQELLLKAFQVIEGSDLVLIEATEKGMGVGIEAGFAFARGIKIVTVARKGADLSVNLKSLSSEVIFYEEIKAIKIKA